MRIKSICAFLFCGWFSQPCYAQYFTYNDSLGGKHKAILLNHKFKSPAVFRFAHFYKHADLNHVVFQNRADFSNAVFDQSLDINHGQFGIKTTFENGRFMHDADFNNCNFSGSVSFKDAQFNFVADFNHCRFDSFTNFQGAIFLSKADFNNTYFPVTADFGHANFDSVVDFEHATFGKALLLNNLGKTPTGKALFAFNKAVLPDTIDFSGDSLICCKMDLLSTNLDSNKVHYINLCGSNISMLRMDYVHFRLFFPSQTDTKYIIGIYEDLLKNFRDLNDMESYQALESEYINISPTLR